MSQLPTTVVQSEWTPEQLKLITDTVAKGASNDELQLFLYRAKAMALDPLRPGQIHFIKYGSGPGTVVIGIDGFRSKAESTQKHDGTNRGLLRDEKGKCIGAWCEVWRKDRAHSFKEEVSLAEYNTGKGPWAKMPETMIKKVAECAALRMAFPDQLGGVYSDEEMDQAKNSAPTVFPEQPKPGDGVKGIERSTVIPSGQFKQKSIYELNMEELFKLEDSLMGKESLSTDEMQTLEQIKEHIVTLENMPSGDAPITCDCGSSLKYSDKKDVYYCSNFKTAGTHIRPIPKREYEQMLKN